MLDLIDFDKVEKEAEAKGEPKAVAETPQEPKPLVANVTQATDFTKAVDQAKIQAVQEAAASDEKFVKDFTEELKQATLKAAQVEQEKQALEKQNVQYHQELLETQQKLNEKEQQISEWDKKQKRRQYHYDGVRPIMEFVGIETPMNLFFLYFLTIFLIWFYLLNKLYRGTLGALIAGAGDEDRPKTVKGFLWTMVAFVVTGLVALAVLGVLLILRSYGIINF